MKNKNYIGLIGRYLSGDITAGEKADLMAWVEADQANRMFFDEMDQLWGISEEYEAEPLPLDMAKAWTKLESRLEPTIGQQGESPMAGHSDEQATIIRMRPLRRMLPYAAAILLLLAAGYWLFFPAGNGTAPMASIQTAAGEQQQVVLPDGSTVVLNENSRLAYRAPFIERRVELTGEAFFDVQKQNGKPFTIDAEGATTTVLGTSFNVRAYPGEEEVAVSVQTGKVALQKTRNTEEKIILDAGEAGVYKKQEEVVEEVAISNADSWKTHRLDFNNTKLKFVVEAMERHFKVRIELANPQLLNCEFIGSYPNPKLKDILEALNFTMDLQIEQNGSNIVLDGDASNCK